MASPTELLDHYNVFTETRSIIVTYRGHFYALGFLFVFPLWFCLISLPPFLRTIIHSKSDQALLLTLAFIYALFVFSLYVAGIATIIYSTHQAFDRRPLRLFTTIKSLTTSFFPLSSTILAFAVCLILLCIVPLIYAALIPHVINIFDYSSHYFVWFCVFAFFIIIGVGLFLTFCQVYCLVASVIAVLEVESKWGFEPLRRSYYLIKQLKSDSFSAFFLHGIAIWLILLQLGFSTPILSPYQSRWSYCDAMLIAITCLIETSLTVKFVAAVTVLYLSSKDLQERSQIGIPNEYTSLAGDDTTYCC